MPTSVLLDSCQRTKGPPSSEFVVWGGLQWGFLVPFSLCMWRSESSLQDADVSFLLVYPCNGTQVIRICRKQIYPWIISPTFTLIFMKLFDLLIHFHIIYLYLWLTFSMHFLLSHCWIYWLDEKPARSQPTHQHLGNDNELPLSPYAWHSGLVVMEEPILFMWILALFHWLPF